MKVKIFPGEIKQSLIKIPPSKSMAHRAIICASLAKGKSTITNIDYSVDIKTTIDAMRLLGAKIEEKVDSVVIDGIEDFNQLINNRINCNESGSTLRFLIPIFSLCSQEICFTGSERLLKRPLNVYSDLFNSHKETFIQNEREIVVNESIKSGEYTISGNVSSQFISGLLFALPFCKGDSILRILKPFESRSYVDLTIEMMAKFNVVVSFIDETTIYIKGNQTFQPNDVEVEGDFSQLGFFAALGAINKTLDCVGLRHDSLQGDKQLIDILNSMNIKVEKIANGYRVHKGAFSGTTINLQNCPDLGPILMVLASFANTSTHITNAQRLRIKESDRIDAMQSELIKCGVKTSSTVDEVFIEGCSVWDKDVEVFGHNDHRIVMSFAIAATVSKKPLIIDDAQAIAKSYPSFFDDLKMLGVRLEKVLP